MHWKLKAKIQNALMLLPPSASYTAYYWIQRHWGGLKHLNPTSKLTRGIEIWKRIQKQGCTPSGKVFLEVGTGKIPLIPLAYWLMGAKKTISIDLNPYLKAELVSESLQYIYKNKEKILSLFGSLVDQKRFDELLAFSRDSHFSLSTFLDLCRVDYIAPGDAANTGLPGQSIDFHTSHNVFEHIPVEVLRQILEEGQRVIKNGGLFIHRIDYIDHFSYSDRSISAINFLKYSDTEWKRYTANRYMYMNRLRHDDFISLFESAGYTILEAQPTTNLSLQQLLKNGNLPLNEKFSSKPEETLAIMKAWITLTVPQQLNSM